MTGWTAVLLFLAGIGGGLAGSITGLASLVTYPALLVAGLPPLVANVTNTVSLVFSSAGSITGSRPELAGRRHDLRAFVVAGFVGGSAGGALLLVTPGDTFARVVPVFVALGAVAVLLQRELVDEALAAHHQRSRRPWTLAMIGVIAVYGGYFGAGAGVLLLGALLWATGDTLPRCSAARSVVLGAANSIAAVAFAFLGDVRWAMVLPLGLGAFLGARVGPAVVRRSNPLHIRAAIAVGGIFLAVKLGLDAYW